MKTFYQTPRISIMSISERTDVLTSSIEGLQDDFFSLKDPWKEEV